MALQIYIRDDPVRTLALVSGNRALIFANVKDTSVAEYSLPASARSARNCMVKFTNNVNLSAYHLYHSSALHGTLGLINVGSDLFLCVITGALRVANVRANETVHKIVSVEFFCVNDDAFDIYNHDGLTDTFPNNTTSTSYDENSYEHPCQDLKNLLSDGTFFFSVDFDLTSRLQHRISESSAFDIDSFDDGFLWNKYLIEPLVNFRSRLALEERTSLDLSRILTSAIRGFALSLTIPVSVSTSRDIASKLPASLTLISRLSCRRVGTRFNARGIDDEGHVANFVESEIMFWQPGSLCFSFVQVRGSVPIFWEQASGILPGQQKIEITRSPEATQPAFNRHFEGLESNYGVVEILNLLSESRPGEFEITERFKNHIRLHPLYQSAEAIPGIGKRLLYTQFDVHAEFKAPGSDIAKSLKRLIQSDLERFEYFMLFEASDAKLTPSPVVALQQEGVFRTNCLDCLDRTNQVQAILSQMALQSFFNSRGDHVGPEIWYRHSSLWADNGDILSKIYAGTGALKSSLTRHGKLSFAGALADARKSATRIYTNNFLDKGKQITIDMLLGRQIQQRPVNLFDPINDYVNRELERRLLEYSKEETISMWVGTFNVNGKINGAHHDLSSWIRPRSTLAFGSPEIFAVGFQEIVELSPQQIVSTDSNRRQIWEEAVGKCLNQGKEPDNQDEYVLLRSGQLVGAVLMIFVKRSSISKVKNVECSVKKTGLSGMAGNKGAVAIRLDFCSSRLCFVTAHLAAGFANFDDRNRDFKTISTGLRFQRNRSIEDHDAIIWAGDFNYRIGLNDDIVRQMIERKKFDELFQNDQLNLQMMAGRAFPFYSESRIVFPPTYKYRNGTDEYEISEKVRIPAWCDRILRKGSILRQSTYTTASLNFSDHRPIYGILQCTIKAVDETKRQNLSENIYNSRKLQVDRELSTQGNVISDDTERLLVDKGARTLPQASTERSKWWLSDSRPAKAQIGSPESGFILNDNRPNNPFTLTNEPDWVNTGSSPGGYVSKSANKLSSGRKGRGDLISPSIDFLSGNSEASSNISDSRKDIARNDISSNVDRQDNVKDASPSRGRGRKAPPPKPAKPKSLRGSGPGSDTGIRAGQVVSLSDSKATSLLPKSSKSTTLQPKDKHFDPLGKHPEISPPRNLMDEDVEDIRSFPTLTPGS